MDDRCILRSGNAPVWLRPGRYEVRRMTFHYKTVTNGSSGLISSDNFKLQIFGTLTPSSSISGVVVAIYEIGAFVGAMAVMTFGQSTSRS